MCFQVESIPDNDFISRQINSPNQYDVATGLLIAKDLFVLSSQNGESVSWRKYASVEDVHSAGFVRQAAKRRGNSPRWTYEGSVTTSVGAVRAIRNMNQNGFTVLHVPKEGQAHAEIHYLAAGEAVIPRAERSELNLRLGRFFAALDLEAHICTDS